MRPPYDNISQLSDEEILCVLRDIYYDDKTIELEKKNKKLRLAIAKMELELEKNEKEISKTIHLKAKNMARIRQIRSL